MSPNPPARRRARASGSWRWGWLVGLGLVACTEPNPYLPAVTTDGASEGSGGSGPGSGTAGPGTTEGDASSSSGAPPSSCTDAGMQCVSAAPEGFEGPFAWLEQPAAAEPLSCPAPFDIPLVEAFSTITAPSARCACNCGAFTGADCGAATLERYADEGCPGTPTATRSLTPGCNGLPGIGWSSSASFRLEPGPIEGGGCIPLAQVERPPAAFLTRHLACAGVLPAMGCGLGQQCAPALGDPFAPRWCVWQAGDVACPEQGDYTERTLLHQDLEDTRGCQPCSCTAPTGDPCTGGTAVMSRTMDCSVIVGSTLTPGSCVTGPGGTNLNTFSYSGSSPSGSCTPAVVVPTGDASGIEPVTFCCTP